MNPLFLIFIVLPATEIFIIIQIGQYIGGICTIAAILLTAIVGIFFARIQGLSVIKRLLLGGQQFQREIFYEIISGASIAIAAILLIIPGFLTDTLGFLILIPFVRKIILSKLIKFKSQNKDTNNIVEGEIEDEKDELQNRK